MNHRLWEWDACDASGEVGRGAEVNVAKVVVEVESDTLAVLQVCCRWIPYGKLEVGTSRFKGPKGPSAKHITAAAGRHHAERPLINK